MIPLFRPYVAPWAPEALRAVFESGMIGEGPQVTAFEADVRRMLGADVACVSSGTAALWLAYHLAGIRPGDRIVTTPLGCLASTETLLHFGARIAWADVDPDTGQIDPEDVRRKADGARAVVAVDWGGSPAFPRTLRSICDAAGATFIEDAAHAFGAHHGPAVADHVTYSFQAIKMLTTGDGGAIVSRDPRHRERARLLRWFGLDRTAGASMRCTQTVAEPGYKFQMNDLAAAIGRANLVGVDTRMAAHRRHAARYDDAFAGIPGVRPLQRATDATAWLYSLRVPCARAFIHAMGSIEGVECSQVHARNDTQPMFAASATRLRGMDTLEQELVCLPVGWWLTEDDVAHVIAATRRVLGA